MYRITTDNGRVGHIAGSIFDGNEGRVVTTVCGKTHPESEFHVDDELDVCAACDKKFYNLVDEATDIVATEEEAEELVAEAVKEAEKPAKASKVEEAPSKK